MNSNFNCWGRYCFQRVVYTPVLIVVVDDKNVERVERIFESAKTFGHRVFFVRLESGLDEDSIVLNKFNESWKQRFEQKSPKNVDELKKVLDSMIDKSARLFFLERLKKKVLLKTSELLECSKLFTSESSNNLAVNIISG